MTDHTASDAVTAHAEYLAERLDEAGALVKAFQNALRQRRPVLGGPTPTAYIVTCNFDVEDRMFRLEFYQAPLDLVVPVDITDKELTAATKTVEGFREWVGHWLVLVDAETKKLHKAVIDASVTSMSALTSASLKYAAATQISVEKATESLKAVSDAFAKPLDRGLAQVNSRPVWSGYYETGRAGERRPRTALGSVLRPMASSVQHREEFEARKKQEEAARLAHEEREALQSIKQTIAGSDARPDR